MTVKYLFPRNRLEALLQTPGGVTCPEAFAAAQANLALIADEVAAEVDRSLALLQASVGCAVRDSETAARRRIYACARTISGLAAYCDLAPLGAVAFSLCELSDRLIEAGRWDSEAVEVHITAMAVIRELPALQSATCDSVIAALVELVRKAAPPP